MPDEGAADAALVGNLRALADLDAVVDDAAKMLDKVSVEVCGDGPDRLVEQDVYAR